MGIAKPVYLLTPGDDTADIVNMAAMAVFEASAS
jgi:phosphotransacetylase